MINIFSSNFSVLLKATLETLDMVLSSTLIAVVIGVPLGIFLALNNRNNIFKIIISFIANVIRSIPYIVFVLLISPLTVIIIGKSYGSQAAKVPLTLISLALIIRTTQQTIKLIPNDLFKLSKSLGATKYQTIYYFVIKETLPSLILGITTVIISTVSYSTVMGIVAGGGLGNLALTYGLYEYDYKLLLITIIILVIIIQVIQVSGNILSFYLDKEKYRRKKKR